jgi:hypothetical protein
MSEMSQQDDRRGALIGLGCALVLFVGFVGYLTRSILPIALGTIVVVAVGALGFWLWDRPERAPGLDRLPPEEQARRREVARILKQVVPPVSQEEARRMLAPPWERGPDDWPQRPSSPSATGS